MATSSSKCQDSRQLTPLRDTRAQLFVGNLPYRVRWQDLKDLFRRAGTVLRADVSLGPDNRSRGYGTVLLATAEDAGRAIDMLNGYCWQTRVLEVRPDRLGASVDEMGGSLAIRGANGHPPGLGNPYDEITFGQDGVGGTGMKTLFVGNLPFHIQWQDLKDLFRAAGAVARADVTVGPDGRSRGFGTVSFVTEDGAERARRMFDGYEFNGRPLKVHYDKFSPSAAPVPLVGVQIPVPSTLSQYDALASHLQSLQLESHQLGRQQNDHLSQLKIDGLLHSQLDSLMHPQLDPLRRADLDPMTSSQLEVLLTHSIAPPGSRSSDLSLGSSPITSASLTSASPALLHTQSLAPSTAHSLAPTPTHPHSLTSSPHLGFSNNGSTNFAPLSLSLGTDALTIKLSPHSGIADSLSLKLNTDMKLGSDMHPLSSNKSRTSSSSSPRQSVSAGSSQAQSYTTTTSSGSSRPSFSTASSLADGTNFSQRLSFGASQSQRPSFSSSTSQRPTFSSTSQRPSFSGGSARRPTFSASSVLNEPFFDDEREGQGSVGHPVNMSTSRENSGSSSSSTFSLPHTLTRPKSVVGSDTASTSPPASGGWPSMSSPLQTSPKSVMLAHSILNSDLSNKSQSTWGASEVESNQGSMPAKLERSGDTDVTATALGSLGLRRSKALASKAAEKNKTSSPNPKPTSPSPQKQTSPQKPSQASSRRQPGPIALPPPCTFTLPHPPVLSPYLPPHPQSPMYHAGYPPSHPMSPLHHPGMRSPIHHPTISPLHSPYHMHYGVITPHGLPPITPSMPPFTFLQPTNGRAITTEQQSSNDGSYRGQAAEGRTEAPPPSSPYHLPPHSQTPYSSHLPSHMLSPGIPLSPGIMVPISTGYPSSVTMVPLTPGGVPMTPGVTMTPGAFWPQAPWINPAPGAPVHADEQWHNHGHPPNSGGDYFPPQGGPDNDIGYFPPVCSIAKEIFKEGSEFHSSEREGESQSRSSSACAGMVSPTPKLMQEGHHIDSNRGHREARRSASPQPNRFTTTEGGHVPRRAGLIHRPDSDPSNGQR